MGRAYTHHSRLFTIFLVVLIIACPALAITVFPSNTTPLSYNAEYSYPIATTPDILFEHSCPNEHHTHTNASVIISSQLPFASGTIYPSSDSFVRGTIDAWAQHQHLVLRPDEVWFQILTQMNFYMSAHGEELRDLFVNHEGKETITIMGKTWESIILRFQDEIQKRLKTPWMLDWIRPAFTTTVEDDKMTANVLMMGLMKTYFVYVGYAICGLPSVTLLGEKSDWETLLAKLERLPEFGPEPKAYAQQLRPILSRFVQTFDKPDDPDIRGFWNTIIHAEAKLEVYGPPPYVLSGWLMGFFFWDREGGPLGYWPSEGDVVLDGIKYPSRWLDSLPVAYAQAPFIMKNRGGMEDFPAYVLAGNIAKEVRKGLPEGYANALMRFNKSDVDEGLPHGIVQPRSGWFLYGPAPSNLTEESPGAGGELWNLALTLKESDTPQAARPEQIRFGEETSESSVYHIFREELQQALDQRAREMEFDWDD